MQEIAFLNGKYIKKENAVVPISDRGFLFGDGVYEVIPVYQGVCFGLDLHVARLYKSLQQAYIEMDYSISEIKNIIQEVVAFNPEIDQYIYVQITRGSDLHRQHEIDLKTSPTVLVTSNKRTAPNIEELIKGTKAVTMQDLRWQNCNIKATSLLANVMLIKQANNLGASEAILLHNGIVTEGCKSNVFVVKNSTIITPPLRKNILKGVTRDIIIFLAKTHDIPIVERTITYEELTTSDEIWLSSSTKEITPVLTLDQKPVGAEQAGPIWCTIIKLYKAYITELISREKSKSFIS